MNETGEFFKTILEDGKNKKKKKNEFHTKKFSENFEKYVKPYIKNQTVIENIYKSWDNDYIQSLNKKELLNIIKSLSRLANIRIGSYLGSSYYKETAESGVNDLLLAKPTPMAYIGLIAREGSIKKFNIEEISNLSLNKIRKKLSSIRQFVSEESSVLGKSKGDDEHGFYRILNQRYEMFTNYLKQEYGRKFYKYFNKDFIKSESFSKLFWGVFNRLRDVRIAMKYDKEQFSSMLVEEVYPNVYKYSSADRSEQNEIESEIAEIFKKRYKGVYEEEQKNDIPSFFTTSYRAGRNRW